MIVVLLGYMGSGKSSVGSILAKRIGYKFLDLDHYIEQQEKRSISELFEKRGSLEFRKIEAETVRKICRTSSNTVFALGGGTPCYGNTMAFLNEDPHVFTIYLKSSVGALAKRLSFEKSKRPLIANIKDSNLEEFIAKHMFERSAYYNRAQWSVSVENSPIKEIARKIHLELDKHNF